MARRRALLLFEPPDGGVAENVLQLATGLPSEGWHVEIAGPVDASIYPQAEAAGVRIHPLEQIARGYRHPERDLGAIGGVARLVRRREFDLVHAHSAKAGTIGRLAARRARVPAVYSPHCFGFVGDVGLPRRAFAVTAERALGRATAAIICACEAERARALERRIAPADKLERVHYGTPQPSGEVSAELLEFRGDGLLVGAVSVLREQKRLDLLLEAAPRILSASAKARIAVIGNGPLEARLREQADRLGLSGDPRFRFLPFAPPSEQYLAALDVYTLPSAWEAMPIGALEALACGVPQVATAVEGTPEAVGEDTGLLIPPGDVDALCAAVLELLGDPERRRRMSAASLARHESLFSLTRMVSETAAVYDRVL